MACLLISNLFKRSRSSFILNQHVFQGHKVRHDVHFRHKSTASVAALKEKQQEQQHQASSSRSQNLTHIETIDVPKDPLDLTFSNTKQAYKSKTTLELIRALVVLKLSSYGFLIDNHAKVSLVLEKKSKPFDLMFRFPSAVD